MLTTCYSSTMYASVPPRPAHLGVRRDVHLDMQITVLFFSWASTRPAVTATCPLGVYGFARKRRYEGRRDRDEEYGSGGTAR